MIIGIPIYEKVAPELAGLYGILAGESAPEVVEQTVWRSEMEGAEDGTRTRDLLITNQLLYQLSYFGVDGEHATRAESRKL